jgi:hypothetical protein
MRNSATVLDRPNVMITSLLWMCWIDCNNNKKSLHNYFAMGCFVCLFVCLFVT